MALNAQGMRALLPFLLWELAGRGTLEDGSRHFGGAHMIGSLTDLFANAGGFFGARRSSRFHRNRSQIFGSNWRNRTGQAAFPQFSFSCQCPSPPGAPPLVMVEPFPMIEGIMPSTALHGKTVSVLRMGGVLRWGSQTFARHGLLIKAHRLFSFNLEVLPGH